MEKEKQKTGPKVIKLTKKMKVFIREKTLEGWTDAAICVALKKNMCRTTFYRLKRDYKEFFDELEDLKYISDEPVINSLRKNATGFKYEEKHWEIGEEINPETGKIEQTKKLIKVIEKYSLPETAACMCWLTNRHNEWKHRQHTDITSGGEKLGNTIPIPDYSNMSEEEAKKAYEQAINEEKAKKQ